MEKTEFVVITCKDCGKNFRLYGREAAFYDRNHLERPKRCRLCRDKRKAKAGNQKENA